MGSSKAQNPNQDLIDQVLVRVHSGQDLEQAVTAVGSLSWFYTRLTRKERAPILRAYGERQASLQQRNRLAKK
ncbi:hypothetical protein [Spirosoma validum]|uniref:Uncharacterized protein n=1 Tax=Spirosoma validum TaxID=2771355 RepID=A0A927GH10_9BACT|nr:hypothetical protein [Spirosoma validum]MBD2757180.1 hypothetical protein [Spirosoma validum]